MQQSIASTSDNEPASKPLDILTIKEAAEALRVSRWTVNELIRKGELASFKIGACRCVPVAAVQEYVSKRLAAEAA